MGWRMNQEELTLTICTLCLELYFKVALLMKVCVQAIWENVATKVKLLCVMWKLPCKVCSQESCSLELECKAGGKFHMKLNICLRLIVYKYHFSRELLQLSWFTGNLFLNQLVQ